MPKPRTLERFEIVIEGNDDGIFVLVEGVRIAERGMDEAGDMVWLPLDPDWIVESPVDHETISVRYVGEVSH